MKDLFISKTRVKLLQTFLSWPQEMFHVRGLVRQTKEEINAVRRELAHMERSGMVKKEPRGNRLYYWFRKDYRFYPNLLYLIAKTTGLGASLIKNRNRLGKLSLVILSGKFVRHLKREEKEIDLLVVGQIVMPELAALVKKEEARRGQEINYAVMSGEEFRFRRARQDPFLISILLSSRVIIWGDEEQLLG